MKYLVFSYNIWNLPKSMNMEFLHAFENQGWKNSIFDDLIKFNKPLVEFVLFDIKNVIHGQVLNKLLKYAHHIAKEAHADHFDENLIHVLNFGVTINISIAYGCERRNDPVNTRNIDATKI